MIAYGLIALLALTGAVAGSLAWRRREKRRLRLRGIKTDERRGQGSRFIA